MTLAVDHTVRFLEVALERTADVLEVGCGTGEVARELMARGHHVIGIDADSDAVAAAKANGVDAVLSRWPAFGGWGVFDAVIFTRSLHHIDPLPGAVDRAADLLHPGGLLVVEDFAYGDMDPEVLRAFALRLRDLAVTDEFLAGIRDAADPATAWHYAHSHELHRWSRMKKAIARRFQITREETAPYLYRYLPEEHAQAMFDWELTLGERMLGRRLVGEKLKT